MKKEHLITTRLDHELYQKVLEYTKNSYKVPITKGQAVRALLLIAFDKIEGKNGK